MATVIALSALSGCVKRLDLADVLEVSIRPSLLYSSTGVLFVRNRSVHSLKGIRLAIRNIDSNKSTTHIIASLDYGGTTEVGMIEANWAFEPNEEIEFTLDGYRSVTSRTFTTDKGTVGIRKPLW